MEDHDLLRDLSSLGIDFEFKRGVDWGYCSDLQGERTGRSSMLFTVSAMERLVAAGHAAGGVFVRQFSFDKEFNTVWQKMYRVEFFAIPVVYREGHQLYKLCGSCGDSGFGAPHTYIMRPRTVALMQKHVEEKLMKIRG